MNARVFKAIDILKKQFESPKLIIKKRNSKLLDYERMISLQSKGEEVPIILKQSAEMYSSINAQLCEELPLFNGFVKEFIEAILLEISAIQANFYKNITEYLQSVFKVNGLKSEDITSEYLSLIGAGRSLDIRANNIELLKRWWADIQMELTTTRTLIRASSDLEKKDKQLSSMNDCGFEVFGIYDFDAEFEDQLNVRIGDRIVILTNEERHGSDEWWFGESSRGIGWVPKSFVERKV
jgi:hypothetical protein